MDGLDLIDQVMSFSGKDVVSGEQLFRGDIEGESDLEVGPALGHCQAGVRVVIW